MSRELVHEGTFFYPTIEALSAAIASDVDARDIDGALLRIQTFVQAVIRDRRATAKVFADAVLDRWCQRLGAIMRTDIGAPHRSPNEAGRADCVILATELYRAGGHTAVIEELLRTGRFGPKTVVLLTDVSNEGDLSVVAERLGDSVKGEIAPSGNAVDKLRWTIERVSALRPRRLMLFNHHHDAVAIAAAQPDAADETVFYHHGDHHLCLGVTLAHTLHVDPHAMGFNHCRAALGIDSNVYWPLVAADQGRIVRRGCGAPANGALRTCSSGSAMKFIYPYKYQYADILPQMLDQTGGTHVHIGPLPDDTLARIHTALDARGIERTRFEYVHWVPSVWKALEALDIDLYIASFPLGGGRAAVEVMGAGIPMIAHDCYISPFYGGKHMLYPSAFAWQRPEQLYAHLARLTREELIDEGDAARAHYERYHTPAALERFVDAGRAASPPPMAAYAADPMQAFLDDVQYALSDHLTAQQLTLAARAGDAGRALRVRDFEREALTAAYEQQALALMRHYGREIRSLRTSLASARNAESGATSGSRVKQFIRAMRQVVTRSGSGA